MRHIAILWKVLLLPEVGKARAGKGGKKLCNNSCGRRGEGERGAVLSLPLPSSFPLAFNAAESKTTMAEVHSVLFPGVDQSGEGTVTGEGAAVEFSPRPPWSQGG